MIKYLKGLYQRILIEIRFRKKKSLAKKKDPYIYK